MKYIEDFRNPVIARILAEQIHKQARGMPELNLMEVCGSHTMAIARYGIRKLLPGNVRLISGPGCPVCVTPMTYLDKAIAISRLPGIIVATFGDMMRVPGSHSSLEKARADGADIRIVYSTLDALRMARDEPQKNVVFLGVGFETTAPTVAGSITAAVAQGVKNYSVLCGHKTMPGPMAAIVDGMNKDIQGFICPAHVSTIIGSKPYEFLAEKYGKACVIAGFEPLDVLEAVGMLLKQIADKRPRVEIQYTRVTTADGNPAALTLMDEIFETCDDEWRGIGMIPGSGLKIRPKYAAYDAGLQYNVDVTSAPEPNGCRCGEVMQGLVRPAECMLFGSTCTPEEPVGACMVSSEGSCAASYTYEYIE